VVLLDIAALAAQRLFGIGAAFDFPVLICLFPPLLALALVSLFKAAVTGEVDAPFRSIIVLVRRDAQPVIFRRDGQPVGYWISMIFDGLICLFCAFLVALVLIAGVMI
jgi:hypothetical protein